MERNQKYIASHLWKKGSRQAEDQTITCHLRHIGLLARDFSAIRLHTVKVKADDNYFYVVY